MHFKLHAMHTFFYDLIVLKILIKVGEKVLCTLISTLKHIKEDINSKPAEFAITFLSS